MKKLFKTHERKWFHKNKSTTRLHLRMRCHCCHTTLPQPYLMVWPQKDLHDSFMEDEWWNLDLVQMICNLLFHYYHPKDLRLHVSTSGLNTATRLDYMWALLKWHNEQGSSVVSSLGKEKRWFWNTKDKLVFLRSEANHFTVLHFNCTKQHVIRYDGKDDFPINENLGKWETALIYKILAYCT